MPKTLKLDKLAPVCAPAPRKYPRRFVAMLYPDIGHLFRNWDSVEVNSTRMVPHTKGQCSLRDMRYWRHYVKMWGLLYGLRIGYDFGMQSDPWDNCIKIIRLSEARPTTQNEYYL